MRQAIFGSSNEFSRFHNAFNNLATEGSMKKTIGLVITTCTCFIVFTGCIAPSESADGSAPADMIVVAPTCGNQVWDKDLGETDTDCGGPKCGACGIGKNCLHGSDCQSGLCSNNQCAAPQVSCSDGVKNGNETDVDCGDGCKVCEDGKNCRSDGDCKSNHCSSGVCSPQPPTCLDGKQNGTETDVDCGGGSCTVCADGRSCLRDSDCLHGDCRHNVCQPVSGGTNPDMALPPPTCGDGVKNGAETDTDCGGGFCPVCADGRACLRDSDCLHGDCRHNVCQPVSGTNPDLGVTATCSDGAQNNGETAVDCGGPNCTPCDTGKACIFARDCKSGLCNNNTCAAGNVNPQPSCTDRAKNGTETDVDCGGGTCPKCGAGAVCGDGTDCQSGTCTNKVCVGGTTSCSDGIRNGTETDVDCGGGTCQPCRSGQKCSQASDCAGNYCSGGVCVTAACSDGVKNGTETDVDCGGNLCQACGFNLRCLGNADCASQLCFQGACTKPASCGNHVKDGQETDVDCGGLQCGQPCSAGLRCLAGTDCQSNTCTQSVCAPGTACNNNGIVDNGETDIDCGGTSACPRCGVNQRCIQQSDCSINYTCSGGFCRNYNCRDGIQNGQETGVDCGGPDCVACGQQAGTCNDNIRNNGEVGTDCGGPCLLCDNQACTANSQCKRGYCSPFSSACSAPPTGASYASVWSPVSGGLLRQLTSAKDGAVIQVWDAQGAFHEAPGANQPLQLTLSLPVVAGYIKWTARGATDSTNVQAQGLNLCNYLGNGAAYMGAKVVITINGVDTDFTSKTRVCHDVDAEFLYGGQLCKLTTKLRDIDLDCPPTRTQ